MIIRDDEIRLNAVLERAGEKPAEGIVILLHGFSSSLERLHNVQAAQAMREAGLDTLRFDLYGHGKSGGEFRNHTLYKWISNTMAVIDYVRGLGYGEIYLSGHSQGGLTAALTAGMEAERIRGLILRAPAFLIPQWIREGNMLGYSFDPEHIPESVPVIKGLELSGNYARVAREIRVEEAMERFSGPVLILHGDEDDVVPLPETKKLSERYRCCEFCEITGETHHFDRHPDRMQQKIRTWLEQLRRAR